jgi:hypothetical protein
MHSFLNRLFGWPSTSKPKLVCSCAVWGAGVRELGKRTRGKQRESGAFLLGREEGTYKEILNFVYYDDIDPHALDTGIVRFSGNKLPKLWALCRERDLSVVADVHVHPRGCFQSASDRADPVMPRVGHIAIILPNFAARKTRPGGIGIYEYLGNGAWQDHSAEGAFFFRVGKNDDC